MSFNPELEKKVLEWQTEYVTPQFLKVRVNAEAKARKLLDNKLRRFTAQDLDDVLKLLNTELSPSKNKATYTRFAQSFIGANAKNIVKHLSAFNDWSPHFWTAPESELAKWLNLFWDKNPIPGAGIGLPTAILYLRNPSHYNIWLLYTAAGLEHLTGLITGENRTAATYQEYNSTVNRLVRSAYNLQPQAVGFILFMANKEQSAQQRHGADALRAPNSVVTCLLVVLVNVAPSANTARGSCRCLRPLFAPGGEPVCQAAHLKHKHNT